VLNHLFKSFCLSAALVITLSCGDSSTSLPDSLEPIFSPVSVVSESAIFSCGNSFDDLIQNDIPHVENEGTYFFIGYQQVSALNTDAVIARFDDGESTWCRNDYETTNDDSKGIGILWQSTDSLYGVFTITGVQPGESFFRFSSNGWLSSYGQGGGVSISVILSIDIDSGDPEVATMISSQLSNGDTNTAILREFEIVDDRIRAILDSGFSPRKTDRSPFTCSGSSPITWTLDLSFNLETALASTAENCL